MHASFCRSFLSTKKFIAAMFLLLLLPTLLHPQYIRAETGDSCEVSDDCDPGERCKRGICGPRQSRNRASPDTGREQPNYPNERNDGTICCDQFGNSRCQMVNGPQPIGSSCFCYGQGYGWVCR